MGGSWTLDRLWERLGIGAAIRRVAKRRRLDGEAVERVIFALVAQRALEPGSKLAATGWVGQRVAIEGCDGFSDDQAYRGMDFLLAALDEIAAEVFASVAHLLNLDLDIVFVDSPANLPPGGAFALIPRQRLRVRSSSSCRRTLAARVSRLALSWSMRSASLVRVSSSPSRAR